MRKIIFLCILSVNGVNAGICHLGGQCGDGKNHLTCNEQSPFYQALLRLCRAGRDPSSPACLGSSSGVGTSCAEARCGSVLWRLSPLTSPTSKLCVSISALIAVFAPGDYTAGHPPCHDHCARDGGCPTLPSHAAAGQDPRGACPASAAHPRDQHRVRGGNTSAKHCIPAGVEVERRQLKAPRLAELSPLSAVCATVPRSVWLRGVVDMSHPPTLCPAL